MILGSGESTATKRSSRTQKKYHFNEVLVTNLRFKKLLEDSFQRGVLAQLVDTPRGPSDKMSLFRVPA